MIGILDDYILQSSVDVTSNYANFQATQNF